MRSAFGAMALGLAASAWAQAPAGTMEVTADGCKLYLPQGDARGASRIRWSGKCTDGFADGRGVVRIYSGGKISRVAETTFAAGKIASPGESYSIRGGEVIRSRGGDQLKIAASELPTWALELSMLVDDRPRAPSRPAAAPSAPKVDRAAEQQQVAVAEKAKEKAAAAKKAEAERQAEAKREQAESQKRQAEAKVAAEKLAAERTAQQAERKRLQAERDRAVAEAKAAEERAAAAEKLAAEKLAAERAAQDAERRRLQAEREQAMAEARAAAEAKAAADKLAAAKAAQEAEQKRQQAEKERVLAEAKAAADKAVAEQKLAAEKAAAEAKAAEARAATEAKAAADAKAAAEKPRLPGAPGRGFADGGAGVPLRAVVTFKLTTPEGRDLGMATFVAGKGEAEIRQNAAALASVYEKVSPFKAKLLDQPEVAQTCSGPGYVVEARVTYPGVKSYGWYAGCMGDDLDRAAKSMQELESQMHRDYKVSPTSFWAYQYLIVGYVDEQNFRGRSDYEGLARPNMMAPGRVMVLSKPEQWAECNDLVNKDPKLKDKGACLREAVAKLKTQLGLR